MRFDWMYGIQQSINLKYRRVFQYNVAKPERVFYTCIGNGSEIVTLLKIGKKSTLKTNSCNYLKKFMHETGRKTVIDIMIDMDLTFGTSKILKLIILTSLVRKYGNWVGTIYISSTCDTNQVWPIIQGLLQMLYWSLKDSLAKKYHTCFVYCSCPKSLQSSSSSLQRKNTGGITCATRATGKIWGNHRPISREQRISKLWTSKLLSLRYHAKTLPISV